MDSASGGAVCGVRPGFRPSMRRDVTNPARVVPDPHAWRSRRTSAGCWASDSQIRYARDVMAEWGRRGWPEEGRDRLTHGARLLWCDLARISLEDRRRGRIDLTYRQLMVRLGVPLVEVDGAGVVLDPAWGDGLRTLQRTLDELVAGGWVSKGYAPNVETGGHRLCLVLCAPEWFQRMVADVVQLARVKGGRKSNRPSVPEQTRPRPPMIESRGAVARDVGAAKRGLDAARAALAKARAGP